MRAGTHRWCWTLLSTAIMSLGGRILLIPTNKTPTTLCIKFFTNYDEAPHDMPSLANNDRPQSSPPGVRTVQLPFPTPSSVVVLHFARPSNYKAAKDTLQTVIASYAKLNVSAPEVMIIPKPAGPRRLLTALYTAHLARLPRRRACEER